MRTRARICSLSSGGFRLAEQERAPPDRSFLADYAPAITDESFLEIERLALWARSKGPLFYLIGGWAAWRYHRGVGSRDIDVIFPNQQILELFLTEYYSQNGYERTGGLLTPSYHKPVKTSAGVAYIEVDAAQIDRGHPFHENPKLDLPYRILEHQNQVWRIRSEEVLMPTVELLLLQKVKAHRDRSWDLGHTSVDPVRAAFLRSKVAKDEYDIRELAPHVKHWETVARIAEAHSCRHLIADSLKSLKVRDNF
jgi:hypothetical protein